MLKRTLGERRIAEHAKARDLTATPWRDGHRCLLVLQLHFSDHQRRVLCFKHIENPLTAREIQPKASLDQPGFAALQQGLSVEGT